MRYRELLTENYDPTADDLQMVAEWMDTTADNLSVETKWMPNSLFEQDAEEMHDSYDEFPIDREKSEKIMRLVDETGVMYPLYVKAGDSDYFVMEGRHRMVAFYLLELDAVPVAFVSVKDGSLVTEAVGIIDAQNTTVDVKPGETTRQANKFNLDLDKNGKPKLLRP